MSARELRAAADRVESDPAFNRVPGSPDVGKALAGLLGFVAEAVEDGYHVPGPVLDHVEEVARAVLGRDA